MTGVSASEFGDTARRLLSERFNRTTAWNGQTDFSETYRAVAELGWTQLTLPESLGGMGQSFEALASIYLEMGRALSPIPLMASMAAVDALTLPGMIESSISALFEMIGSGDIRVAIAFVGRSDAVVDDVASGEAVVSASLKGVADAHGATHLLLLPQQPGDGPALLVDLHQPAVASTPVEMWDRSRRPSDIELRRAPARIVSSSDAAAELASKTARAHLDLAVACDSLGGTQQALDESVAYMTTRHQFNRPIGSFQALKHRAADLKVRFELASALLQRATAAYTDRISDWGRLAAQARLLATRLYSQMGEEMVQFHGGIGVTWEHDCHRFLKRAKLNELGGESPFDLADRIATTI
ncbi:MAG TPA: acyl-CoA dehydrogenase family protein [Vicinamibacterales bacterium]|nr:acyl-CoA dehydrogenase family protein [Vicinamibacterales bacterium]